jgi:acyl-CoA reductase-like NAD-dependent aldehyde dehydrogenase
MRGKVSVGWDAVTRSLLSALVERAADAWPSVRALDIDARLGLIARSRANLAAVADDLVECAVAEVGTPRRFARREVGSALAVLDVMPSLAEAIRPMPVPARAGTTLLEWVPYGVVLGWHAANSPVWVPTLVAASALAGGNVMLSRPSSRARATTARVLEALAEPWPQDAIVRVDLSGPEAEPLVWADGVHAVVTHAGTDTCKRQLAGLGRAYERGARMRPYIPEGSGNDAVIVLEGADLRRAADAVAVAGFANGGQLCMAAKRIIVQRSIWGRFEPLLHAAVSALVVGPADAETTDVAPLREGRARARARQALAEALRCGGRVVVGEGERGAHFTPTIVALPEEARDVALWREESFAPLRGLMLADNPEDAIERANDSPFGLGAALFGSVACDLVDRLRVARVMIDESPLYQDPHVVVGGVGDSGLAGARPKVEQLVYARRTHHATNN